MQDPEADRARRQRRPGVEDDAQTVRTQSHPTRTLEPSQRSLSATVHRLPPGDPQVEPASSQVLVGSPTRLGNALLDSQRRAGVRLPFLSRGAVVVLAVALLICIIPTSEDDLGIRSKPTHLLVNLTSSVDVVVYSPDGRSLAWAGWDGPLASLVLEAGAPTETISRVPLDRGEIVGCLAFSPDGSLLAIGLYDGRVKLWNTRSLNSRLIVVTPGSTVKSVAFAPDQSVLVTGSADASIRLWNLPAGEQRTSLQRHTASIIGLKFSSDGRILASSDTAGRVVFWDWRAGRQLTAWHPESRALRPHSFQLVQLALGPVGKSRAVIARGYQITLWDVASGKCTATLYDGTRLFISMAMSADGKLLAAGGFGGVMVWDLDTQQRRAVLREHDGGISVLAFSPDGQRLVSVGTDRTLRMWTQNRDFPPAQ